MLVLLMGWIQQLRNGGRGIAMIYSDHVCFTPAIPQPPEIKKLGRARRTRALGSGVSD